MKRTMETFFADEAGAVTVDWVVMTSLVVVLASTIGWSVHNSTRETGQSIGTHLTNMADR